MKNTFKLHLLFFFCLWTYVLNAQPSGTQLEALKKLPVDTSRVALLQEIGFNYRPNNVDSAIFYFNQALVLSDQLKVPDWQVRLRMSLYSTESQRENKDKAHHYMLEALKLAQLHQLNFRLPHIYNNLGISYRELSVPDSSFYYHTLSEKILIQQNQKDQLWKPYNGLCKLFYTNGEFDKAVFYAEKTALHTKDLDSRIPRGVCLYWLAICYFNNNDFANYVKTVSEWDRFMEEAPYNKALDSPRHSNLIVFDLEAPEIENKIKESIKKAVAQEDPLGVILQYQSLGMHYVVVEKIPEAIDAYEKALIASKQINSVYRIYSYQEQLYQLHKQQGNPEALTYLEQHSAMRDSLLSAERVYSLNELEVKYETEQKNEQINLRTTERNYLSISSALLGLFLFISLLFFRNRLLSNRKLVDKEAMLQAQKIKQLEQEKELLHYSAIIDGQEMERRRIAKDLHDSIGGSLSATKAHLTAIKEKFVELDDDALFNKTNNILNHTFDDVRRISLNLMPRVLELMGLQEAIEDLGDHLVKNGIATKIEVIDFDQEPPKTIAINVYRIIQELTNNIFKHAQAKNVLIQLFFKKDQLDILVEDDGIGFDFSVANQSSQLGLSSLQSRVNFLKGEIEFDTVAGEGTAVFIQIPLYE